MKQEIICITFSCLSACEISELYRLENERDAGAVEVVPAVVHTAPMPALVVSDAGTPDVGGPCDEQYAQCLGTVVDNSPDPVEDQVAKCEYVRDRCYGG